MYEQIRFLKLNGPQISILYGLNDSLIVTNSYKALFLAQTIPDLTEKTELKCIFRATRDGWNSSDFHAKCDGKGPTLTFIETSKDRVCGGYT